MQGARASSTMILIYLIGVKHSLRHVESREISLYLTRLVSSRDGCRELLQKLDADKVPLLVFSAGLGDIIHTCLQQQAAITDNLKIVSNFMEFDNKVESPLSRDKPPLQKRECCHFDEIFVTGCIGSCHFDNFCCGQWWKFHKKLRHLYCNVSMSATVKIVGWNYLSIPKLQRCGCWSLGMSEWYNLKRYWSCGYLSMLALKLIRLTRWATGRKSFHHWCLSAIAKLSNQTVVGIRRWIYNYIPYKAADVIPYYMIAGHAIVVVKDINLLFHHGNVVILTLW